MSGKERILNYLKEHKNITQLEAINMFWDWRLSGRIYDLKKDGYNIKSEQIKVKRADGTDAYVTKYILIEE